MIQDQDEEEDQSEEPPPPPDLDELPQVPHTTQHLPLPHNPEQPPLAHPASTSMAYVVPPLRPAKRSRHHLLLFCLCCSQEFMFDAEGVPMESELLSFASKQRKVRTTHRPTVHATNQLQFVDPRDPPSVPSQPQTPTRSCLLHSLCPVDAQLL